MMNWRVRSEERMDPTPEQSFYTSPATLRLKPVSAGLPSEGGPYGRRASTALGVSEELYRLRLKRGRPGNAREKRRDALKNAAPRFVQPGLLYP